MNDNLESIVLEFIHTLQHRKNADELLRFYHEDVEQTEFPNTLTKNKTIRTLDELKRASEKGRQVLQKEVYEILKAYTFESTVIIEALWTRTLAIPLGNIPAGGEMNAYFAQFYEFKDGKIIRQRNYDCFEPLA